MGSTMEDKPILMTGGTGYVGGRLIPRLLEAGYRVRAMARSPERLYCRPWGRHPALEIVAGDALDRDAFVRAAKGCGTAYYLIHSMGSGADFERQDREAAHHFGRAAKKAGVRRIVYLGGLGSPGDTLSPHLRSRPRSGRHAARIQRHRRLRWNRHGSRRNEIFPAQPRAHR